MRNLRSYYSASIVEFLNQSSSEIIGIIHSNDISAETTIQQSNTWESEVQILKNQLSSFSDGRIIFEYTIPRMGKRVDTVVLSKTLFFFWSLSVAIQNTDSLHMIRYTIMRLTYATSRRKAMINYW